ncbi:hypothetical protein HNO88_003670 [Novosphingobium chloroacetimidivorans]|uniref:PEP-CTERM protein-sorting domain-containing protein n=1 Tax=Novosphingobium chloroacetimidivorans TaxID=1428314 RepID=A0A7W7KCL0_9SPHN|nr:NF038132 family protein [Novosphingobium chloroacetimidivorans]MBB4860327.1 hypothetical protein [Novosphingobium chloroacetimidivorans]
MKFAKRLILCSILTGWMVSPSTAIAATCIGNCGKVEGSFSGSVTPAPTNSGSYDWVSTTNGQSGAARIPGFTGSATTGSELISDSFFGAIGQKVSFYFNYITSDGSGFADYGFAQLINSTTGSVANLFTARTQPSGTIAPGLNLPPVEATLTPASVPIIPGSPVWQPLGGSSGTCYSAGCGYTGWIQSEYEIAEAGTYQLRFGAANWSDTAYQSGLAFSGLVLDGNVIGDGSSFESPLLPSEIDPETGAFEFEFIASPNIPVVVDPDVATGYDFSSSLGILTAEFEFLGDNEYSLSFLDGLGVLQNTTFAPAVGKIFDFSQYSPLGVTDFTVTGIDTSLMLDPTDTTAFKTKLTFAAQSATPVNLTQTPLTTFVDPVAAVPETSTWVMMIMGIGFVGFTMRRRAGQVMSPTVA